MPNNDNDRPDLHPEINTSGGNEGRQTQSISRDHNLAQNGGQSPVPMGSVFKSLTTNSRRGDFKVNAFRCPFCAGEKKQFYKYKELAHASGVAKGSATRNAKHKVNHFALAKYLVMLNPRLQETVEVQGLCLVRTVQMSSRVHSGVYLSTVGKLGGEIAEYEYCYEGGSGDLVQRIGIEKEALTELERQKIDEDKKQTGAMNSSLQSASLEKKETDDLLIIIYEPARKKDESLNEIRHLGKELNNKQKLQMEIQELKGKLQVMKHVEDEDEEDMKMKMKEMNEELEDKVLS
ncbi:hypothetical protein Bca101_058572 [Brassica carinata]